MPIKEAGQYGSFASADPCALKGLLQQQNEQNTEASLEMGPAGEEQHQHGQEESPSNSSRAESPPPPTPISLRAFLTALSGRQWLAFAVLYVANLCTAMAFSCIVPFFPTEAKLKGLSTSQVGLIIGVFQLTMFCAAPVLGKFITQIGPNRMFTGGLLLSAMGTMLYSLLTAFPTAPTFFIAAMGFRCATALGNAGFRTSSLTLIAQHFSGHVGSVVGLTQTSMSIGYTVGPTIGSGLYELGGFALPFLALGSLILLSTLVSILLLLFLAAPKGDERSKGEEKNENSVEEEKEEQKLNDEEKDQPKVSLFRILCIPEVALTLVTLFTLELSLFFYDASLTDHLAPLSDHPSLLTGFMLSLTSLVCMLSSPLWGFLIDRLGCYKPLMLSGTSMGVLFPLLMGPSPLVPGLRLSIPSLCVAFALQGLSITMLHTPSFKFCIEGAKRQGFAETNTASTGCISGLLNGAIALGAFIGVTAGGLGVEWVGFELTSTFAGAIHLIPLTTQICLFVKGSRCCGQG